MANVRYYLKNTKEKNKETLIYLRIFSDYTTLKITTGLKVKPDNWNKNTHRAREKKNFPGWKELNKNLDKQERDAKQALEALENNFKAITSENFKQALQNAGKTPRGINTSNNIFAFIENLIKECKEGTRLTDKGKKYALFTIKGYNTTLEHLKAFQIETGYKVSFESLNMEFYKQFTSFFHKQNRATNTIGKHIKNIKVFAQVATRKGIKVHPEVLSRDFKNLHEQTDQVYLTESELQSIYDLDLSNNPKLDKVRDLFIIGCYTGLRFGDLSTLNEASIINNGTLIKVKTQKTGETVTIPLHWMVRAILQKYDNKPPRAISNQKMNEYIKDVCQAAKLYTQVTTYKTKGGFSVGVTQPKHELVTCHTARRSFASNLFLAGVPTISIMKITGHKTEKAFMSYIRISGEENANLLLEHDYFKQAPLKVVKG